MRALRLYSRVSLAWQAIAGGLAAGLLSAPHCAAMCGPLSAAVCQRRGSAAPARYQAGRLLGYTLVGSIAGQLGAALSASAVPEIVLPLSVASALLLLAVRMARSSRGERPVQLASIRRKPLASIVGSVLPRDPLLLGGMSALLPCGALAAALALAAATGSASFGGLVMAGFVVTSGAGVAASGLVLRGLLAVRSAPVARACATLLVVAAAVVLWKPLVSWGQAMRGDVAGESAPTCH